MEIENPSACATVNWKVCKSAIVLFIFPVFKYNQEIVCNRSANKSNHPN
jgi:hypothetical protein